MRKFQKLLRIENKLAKHAFRNLDFTRAQPIDHYVAENIDKRIKKAVHKDSRWQRVKAC